MIKSLVILFSGVAFTVGAWQADMPAALKTHHSTLQAAPSLRVAFTNQKLSGGAEKVTLLYSKPAKFRIESPTRLTVSDGKLVWNYNKTAKTYTEMPASLARVKESDVWSWSSFFEVDAMKGLKELSAKGNRALRGFQVSEFSGKLAGTAVTLYVDVASGMLRGTGGADTIVFATEMAVSKEPVGDKEFVFVAPVGVTKEEPKPVAEVGFASVAPIFKAACLNCHNSGNAKGGYSVADYASVMKRVTPGDAKNSVVVQYIKGVRQPKMPRGGSLSSADIEAIETWVNAGAKN